MGRKSYFGGSTVLSSRHNPYHIENTVPLYVGENNNKPHRLFEGEIESDICSELSGMDFDFISKIFVAIQHAYLHGDITSVTRLAEFYDEYGLGNYVLLLANKIMVGRSFDKRNDQIVIMKNGKLLWDEGCLLGLYRAMLNAQDSEFDVLPLVDQKILQMINSEVVRFV